MFGWLSPSLNQASLLDLRILVSLKSHHPYTIIVFLTVCSALCLVQRIGSKILYVNQYIICLRILFLIVWSDFSELLCLSGPIICNKTLIIEQRYYIQNSICISYLLIYLLEYSRSSLLFPPSVGTPGLCSLPKATLAVSSGMCSGESIWHV